MEVTTLHEDIAGFGMSYENLGDFCRETGKGEDYS